MSFRPLIFLGGSCFMALALAIFALSSGAGFVAAFLIYSFGGSIMLVTLSAVSFFRQEHQSGLAGQDPLASFARFQRA